MLRYLSLFSGIGAFEKALTNLGVKFEVVNYCEIDKYASKSYSAIHGVPESKNLWDITKVNVFNLPKDIDIISHGSPCQDFSLAGVQRGGDKDSETRSSLMWNTVDIVKVVKPKIVLWENVKNLISKKHKHNFDAYIEIMDELGYNSYWKVLNAKDYGIPQNRERVFTVSIRKDIDHNIFEFPKPYSLEKRLKDFLEPHVDEKYYLSEKMVSYISATGTKNFRNPDCKINLDVARPLTTDPNKRDGTTNYISDDLPDNFDLQNECLKIKEKTKKGYSEAQDGDGVYINRPHQKRGVVQKGMIQTIKTSPDIGVVVNAEIKPKLIGGIGDKKSNGGTQYYQQDRIYDSESIAMAHPANLPGGSYKYQVNIPPLRIRKLSPLECWRLMGFSDEDFEKAQSVPTSNAQLYKQAGNSIVVNVLEEIFGMMLDEGNNLLV